MKTHIENYSFNKALGQVTFEDFSLINLEGIYPIVNVTRGIIIYNPLLQPFGGTVSGNVLTLRCDTISMSNDDALMIFYEDGRKEVSASEIASEINDQAITLLRRLVKMSESSAVVDSSMRQKVAVESISGTTLGSSVGGTSSGVPGLNIPTAGTPVVGGSTTYWQPVWIGPVDQRYEIIDRARTAYNLGIRNNLIFT